MRLTGRFRIIRNEAAKAANVISKDAGVPKGVLRAPTTLPERPPAPGEIMSMKPRPARTKITALKSVAPQIFLRSGAEEFVEDVVKARAERTGFARARQNKENRERQEKDYPNGFSDVGVKLAFSGAGFFFFFGVLFLAGHFIKIPIFKRKKELISTSEFFG